MGWYAVLFIVIVLAAPLILVVQNGQYHRWQRVQAEAQGWRYEPAGLLAGLRQTFTLYGETDEGLAWQLTHDSSRQFLIWQSAEVSLPYGKVMIMPRYSQETDLLLKENQLRPIPFGSAAWQDRYTLLNTHDHLSQKYITRELELALLTWPERELPGGFMILVWDTERLEIRSRFHRDWTSFDRLITLGSALLRAATAAN